MSLSVNSVHGLNEEQLPKKIQSEKKINFRAKANNKLERSPEDDTFDNKNKKKKNGKIIGWTFALIAAVLVAIFYKKGKALENAGKKAGEVMEDVVDDAERLGVRVKDEVAEIAGSGSTVGKDVSEMEVPNPAKVIDIEEPLSSSESPLKIHDVEPQVPDSGPPVKVTEVGQSEKKLPFETEGLRYGRPAQKFNRSDYPCYYEIVKDGQKFAVKEEIRTSHNGDEYIIREFHNFTDGSKKVEFSAYGDSTKISSIQYYDEKAFCKKTVRFKEDGITPWYEETSDGLISYYKSDGHTYDYALFRDGSKAYYKPDGTLGEVIKPEARKIDFTGTGIERADYKDNVREYQITEDGKILTVKERITGIYYDEFLDKEVFDEYSSLLRRESTHAGSLNTRFVTYYDRGQEVKTIYYKPDGETIDYIVECSYPEDEIADLATKFQKKIKTYYIDNVPEHIEYSDGSTAYYNADGSIGERIARVIKKLD